MLSWLALSSQKSGCLYLLCPFLIQVLCRWEQLLCVCDCSSHTTPRRHRFRAILSIFLLLKSFWLSSLIFPGSSCLWNSYAYAYRLLLFFGIRKVFFGTGQWLTHSQLGNIQKISDHGLLGSKWDIHITPYKVPEIYLIRAVMWPYLYF